MTRENPSPWSIKDLLLGRDAVKPAWLEHVSNALEIDPGGHPFHAYVGVNFSAAGLRNVKFYFAYYRRLSPGELGTLLPVQDRGRFDGFYAQWHPAQRVSALHRGVTFALKVDSDGTLTHYWHMRTKGLPFGPPERLELQTSDRENYHGACEEFTGGTKHLKRYFYMKHPLTIAESLRVAGMPDRTLFIDLLEYIESDGRDKFSWITRDPRLVSRLVHQRAPPPLAAVLTEMCERTGIGLYAPGSSRDLKDHALYLTDAGPVMHYDGVTPFLTRYLEVPTTTTR